MALLAQAHASQIGFFDAAPAVRFKSHFATIQGICWHNWVPSGNLGQARRLTAKQCWKLPAVRARSRRNVSRRRHARCEATPQRDSAELEIEVQENAEKVAESLGGVNVYLVGMMGSGKSTIGKLLAERLNYRFFDSDEVVERAVGAPISQIFEENGEDAFRKLEDATVFTPILDGGVVTACEFDKISHIHRRRCSLEKRKLVLISLSEQDRDQACNRPPKSCCTSHMHYGISVFLQVPIHTLAKRVTKNGSASRPLLNGGEEDDDQSEEEKAFARLSSIWTVRKGFYETADVTVSMPGTDDGEGMSTLRLVEEVLYQIEKLLKERGVKKPEESSDWMTEL